MERRNPEFHVCHIGTRHTAAYLVTFFFDHLLAVGKVYLQTAFACHSRYISGRLYPNKMPVTAVHLTNNDELPSL